MSDRLGNLALASARIELDLICPGFVALYPFTALIIDADTCQTIINPAALRTTLEKMFFFACIVWAMLCTTQCLADTGGPTLVPQDYFSPPSTTAPAAPTRPDSFVPPTFEFQKRSRSTKHATKSIGDHIEPRKKNVSVEPPSKAKTKRCTYIGTFFRR